jgi:hypothetical protein
LVSGARFTVYSVNQSARDLIPDEEGVMEQSLALFPGWQSSREKLQRRIRRRDVLGAVAQADGAPLGEVELDVLTWLFQAWAKQERPADGRVRFTFYEVAEAMYGSARRGGRNNQIIREALDNLHAVVITLSGVDVLTGEMRRSLYSKVHILESYVLDEQLQLLEASEHFDPAAVGAIGGARGHTIEIKLADWLVQQLLGDATIVLDWRTQRALGGMAKRLWVYLAAMADDFVQIRDEDVEVLDLPLAETTFSSLGIECARERDSRAAVTRAAGRMLEEDPRYLSADLVREGRGADLRFILRVTRQASARATLLARASEVVA